MEFPPLPEIEGLPEIYKCGVCRVVLPDYANGCSDCLGKYGDTLCKSTTDSWEVTLRLKSGREIKYLHCKIHGEWLHISFQDLIQIDGRKPTSDYDRGIDIRIDAVESVVDGYS